MIFTDEDLQYWKERCGHLSPWKALLARLEAAEAVCCLKENHICVVCEASLKAWRKACGVK
jgi:hypothetical protein